MDSYVHFADPWEAQATREAQRYLQTNAIFHKPPHIYAFDLHNEKSLNIMCKQIQWCGGF